MIALSDVAFAYAGSGFRLAVPAFALASGERVAIVGPSGSGKTTLLNLIAGLAVPSAGTVMVDDVAVHALSDRARRAFRVRHIGFVFQNFALLPYLSVRENILYPYRIGGLRLDAAARARADALAEATGLAGKLARKPAALSQGEQQRVAICRALVTEPRLILADEATGNLDPETKVAILDLLFERIAASGASLLAVTHDHALLPRFDRVVDFDTFRVGAAA